MCCEVLCDITRWDNYLIYYSYFNNLIIINIKNFTHIIHYKNKFLNKNYIYYFLNYNNYISIYLH